MRLPLSEILKAALLIASWENGEEKSKKAEELPETLDICGADMTNILADDLNRKGILSSRTSVMVKGTFEGQIMSEGLQVVDQKAKVNTKIMTKGVTLLTEKLNNIK
ncbi:MAG: hypothetical protein C0407_01585 [Desulfobacca sp.]|nr:hypothetical protein [Desulfobacca sp.]